MKGIAKIKGSLNPKIGEDSFYEVVEFHKGTPMPNPNSVKWKIFKKNNGKWEEAKGNSKTGMKVAFNFSPRSYGKEILVEAYLFEPEMKSPPGLVVKPLLGPRKILNTEILDANGGKITQTPKYGQSITLKVTTQNMPGEKLNLSLWERDTFKDSGHDPVGNTRLWSGQSKTIDIKGIVEEKIMLTLAMKSDANKSLFDGSEHEYYLLAEATGMKTISATTQVSNQEVQATVPAKKTAEKLKEEKPIAKQETVKIKNAVGADKINTDDSNKKIVINDTKGEEGIITVYFAKEEFTIKTDEKVGIQYYRFKNDQKKGFDKERTAAVIMERVTAQIKADKKYVKLVDIKNALVEKSYKKDDPISFNLYKLGANYIRQNSAPLEEEVLVVANTYLLDGKEVTIKIKEKEAVLVDANADVMVLEAKENGAEITTLKATVEDNVAKIKIKLRPKADEDLKKWKEKLANGIKDGIHKYTVKKTFTVSGDLDKIASSIEKKSNEVLASKHTVKKADISALLIESTTYPAGTSFEFPKYKKPEEMLWLKAECQGDIKKYEGEYLKKDGEYFVVGKKCECEERIRAFLRMLRVGEGTEGEKGYTRQFSGKQFTDMSNHPHEVITSGGYSSSASGAYQIMADTYDGLETYRTKYKILSFDQESQDKLCVVILKHNYQADRPNSFYNPTYWKDKEKTIRDYEKENKAKERRKRFKGQNGDIIKMLIDNNYEKAALLSALCWASLPDAPYGQPTETKEECKANYEKFLKEELEGKTDLHIKKGFLKEFGYSCSCNKNGSAKWQNPLKDNQITIHTFGGSKRPWRSAFGRVRTDMTGSDNGARPHHGLDLFANIETEVYACLPGEVVSLTPGTGYGNGLVFKIDAEYLDEFKKQRRDYSPYYVKSKRTYDSKKYDIDGYGDFEEYEGISESTDVYLMYAHLSEVSVKLNEKITESNMDKVLGKTGTSGATNTKGPHLHFEIRSKQNPSGYTERYNPAFYIDYKNEDQLTDAERETQDNAAGK